MRGRRDVYLRTDGEAWEVEARAGGIAGRSRVHRCPGRQSAEILAGAWMGSRSGWLLVAATGDPEPEPVGGRGKRSR
ncbi:MAG TPA: hypothetical protein VJT31_16365 [Rugosimonospora sp.]|nr:hypothetical protein [Rugosimonospora sp.]